MFEIKLEEPDQIIIDESFYQQFVGILTLTGEQLNDYSGSEVIFVQSGELTVKLIDETWRLFSGDTATIPKGVVRQFLNSSDKKLEFIRVRGDIKV